ncbi:MAG: hypothetical protein HC812_11305 [Leptolyngbya sp. RL_3_1]|nr:hypothetical protein [Leptolyngbya sp. RL_3_1]
MSHSVGAPKSKAIQVSSAKWPKLNPGHIQTHSSPYEKPQALQLDGVDVTLSSNLQHGCADPEMVGAAV